MLPRPCLYEFEALLEALGTDPWQGDFANWFQTCNRMLKARTRAKSMQFVAYPANLRLTALAYERLIVEQGQIASRHDLHDAVNALIWLRFPHAKLAISQLHLSEAASNHTQGARGKRRDAATLFDEHGLICLTRDADLIDGLRQHQWQKHLFEHAAALGQRTRFVVFGHALLARLATPHKGLIAHVMPVLWEGEDWPQDSAWDEVIAARISALSGPKDFFALPVMGLPGWSAQQDRAFYEDVEVFRPLRAEPSSDDHSSPLKSNSVTVDAGSAIGA